MPGSRPTTRQLLGPDAVAAAVEALALAVLADHPPGRPLNVVGILTRGETLAARLRTRLAQSGADVRRGTLDITLYRDDLTEIGPRPLVRPTELMSEVDGVPLLLVDDVIHTGRSVRAALEAITDFGRPAAVRLAVLVDRGGRELPIQPDYVGAALPPVAPHDLVSVRLAETDGRDAIDAEPR